MKRLFYLLLCVFSFNTYAFDFFTEDSVLRLQLDLDYTSIVLNKFEASKKYSNAKLGDLTFVEGVMLSTYGSSRMAFCDFPMLKLKTKDKKKVYIATHCNSNEDDSSVIKEYLMYRIYNHISDLSLRVRLAQITYRDLKKSHKDITKYALIIEDAEDLARRNNMFIINSDRSSNLHLSNVSEESIAKNIVFQSYINNSDYSIFGKDEGYRLANTFLFMSEDNSKVFFVPHDFDSASFIRANFKWIGDNYFNNRVDGIRYTINKNQDNYPKSSLVYNKMLINMGLINQVIEDLSETLDQEYIDNILSYNKSYFELIKLQ